MPANVYVLDRPFAATAETTLGSEQRSQHRGQATFKPSIYTRRTFRLALSRVFPTKERIAFVRVGGSSEREDGN